MKRLNLLYITCIPLVALLFTSCKKDPDLRMPDLQRGVIINATLLAGTDNLFVYETLATQQMGFTLDFRRDKDNKVIDKASEQAFKSLQVYIVYNGAAAKTYGSVITSIPTDVSITGPEIATALGMPFDSLKGCDDFYFYYMITTKDGIEIKSDNASPQLNNWPNASFSQDYLVRGAYDLTKFVGQYDSFDGYPEDNCIVDVALDPGNVNGLIISNIYNGTGVSGIHDYYVTIDPVSLGLTAAQQLIADDLWGYTNGTLGPAEGSINTCTFGITFTADMFVVEGDFGNTTFELTKR
jgi:hypothetical protein